MNEPMFIGAIVGFLVGNLWDIYYNKITRLRFMVRTTLLYIMIIASFFIERLNER